jgi:hypothetical protein
MSLDETIVMPLQDRHIAALAEAETLLFHFEFCPYFELKSLFADSSPSARDRFCSLFKRFYSLNSAGLTQDFMTRFFEILYEGPAIVDGRPDFATILKELSTIKRHQGDYAMPFSFVSKLVAMHDEASAIYDRHVLSFFGRAVPPASIEKGKRIEWFIGLLSHISRSYSAWANDPRIMPVLKRLQERDAKLTELHPVRLMDFLVWKVGSAKLLPKPLGSIVRS